ncbi:hypothetical protein BDZ97DRAFT_1902828 [Flammula alnicola]|nr:hypothetical protein BDZ97DRAFT_1902828 [Flammula alnicola]
MILRPFFHSKGYTLFNHDPQIPSRLPSVPGAPATDSFGLYGDRTQMAISNFDQVCPLCSFGARDRYGARELQNRDVAIKVVDKYSPDCPDGSTELQILRLLNSPSMRSDPRNATVPVIEFLEFHDWKFVVMPFLEGCDAYDLLTSHECLDFGCQILEDISHENIMMNFRGSLPRKDFYDPESQRAIKFDPIPGFRSTFPVRYSFIDFGQSAYFLPGIHPSKCRGRPHRAPEVNGRFKYDPFAADVYQVAQFFYSWFGRVIYSEVPGIVELLQDMSSMYPPDRISMASAAARMRVLYDQLPPQETLQRYPIEFFDYASIPRSKLRYNYEYLKCLKLNNVANLANACSLSLSVLVTSGWGAIDFMSYAIMYNF